MGTNKSPKPPLSSDDKISRQLELMADSLDFKATPQQMAFLKFIVNQTLTGNADHIKGYTVATEVFGRGADFDQSIDPIVSIQASRLRRALDRYYENAGLNDPIRINIPKGTYVPTFQEQRPNASPIAAKKAAPVSVMEKWPTLLIRKLANLTAKPEDDYLAIGLTAELAHALGHYREIRVLEAIYRNKKSPSPEMDSDFIITGSVRRDPENITVRIRLEDAQRGILIWSGKYQGDIEAVKMISFQEDVAREVAVRVAGDNAIITRHLTEIFKSKATPAQTTYKAMLCFWESDTRLNPRSMERAIRALEHAVALEPEHGQIWTMLAAQYADNYGIEIVDLATPLQKAAEFAQKGVSLEPTNRRARMILSYVRLLENRLWEACYEAQAAYDLCPNSLIFLDRIGCLMALAGEWDRGIDWIQRAIKLNPYHRPWVRGVITLNWLRQGNYEKAYGESFYHMMPENFWDPILKASTCGHLGKIDEGQTHIQKLLSLKPDFTKRGRTLMGRYIKFEDIFERIIAGLAAVGLVVK